jgi:hypothetical protein
VEVTRRGINGLKTQELLDPACLPACGQSCLPAVNPAYLQCRSCEPPYLKYIGSRDGRKPLAVLQAWRQNGTQAEGDSANRRHRKKINA